MSEILPFNKKELEGMQKVISGFISLCEKYDSYGRVIAWSNLLGAVRDVIREEEQHNFTFPSPHNPDKTIKL